MKDATVSVCIEDVFVEEDTPHSNAMQLYRDTRSHVSRRLVRNIPRASFCIPPRNCLWSHIAMFPIARCGFVCGACSRDFYAKRAQMVIGSSDVLHFRFVFSPRGGDNDILAILRDGISERTTRYRIYRKHEPHVSLVNKAYDRGVTGDSSRVLLSENGERHCAVSLTVLRSNRLIM